MALQCNASHVTVKRLTPSGGYSPLQGAQGLDNELLVADTSYMGRTKRSVEVAYLDPDKHSLLKRLAAGTRIPKTVLVREAIDDLLVKYGVLKTPKRKFPSPDSTETR